MENYKTIINALAELIELKNNKLYWFNYEIENLKTKLAAAEKENAEMRMKLDLINSKENATEKIETR